LPLFLAEAAAAGRACVTTDVPGCRSVVEHGVTGLIVPARDATGLTEALAQLLGDASLRQRMGENGRRLALERFSKEVVTRQIFAVYDSLL
jgi:glycosyltransferase involved in cell wall biosynthesis